MEDIASAENNRFPIWVIRREGRRRRPKAGFIDRDGRVVIPTEFDSVNWFFQGRACVKVNGKWGFIDQAGAMVIEPRFRVSSRFSEGVAACLTHDKPMTWELIDAHGSVRAELQSEVVAEVVDGRAWVRTRDERCAFIDAYGRFVTGFDFDGINSYRHGLAPVSVGERWGFLDLAGDMAIAPQFEYAIASGAEEFRGIVEVSGLRGVIDRSGEWILHPQFRSGMPYREGLGWFAWPDGTSAFIDEAGSVVADLGRRIASAGRFSEGLCSARRDERLLCSKGYINRFGEWIIPPSFICASEFRGGRAYVDDSDGFGYIDREGRRIWWSTEDIDTPLELLMPWLR